MLKNSKYGELTRYGFISHMEDYIKQLLTNAKSANVDDYLKSFGITNEKALEMLLSPNDDYAPVMVRTEKIKTNKETGKDVFIVQYKVPKDNYKKKMRALYVMNFEKNLVDEEDMKPIDLKNVPINEDGEGAACGGDCGGGEAMGGGEAAGDAMGSGESNNACGAAQVNNDAPIMPLMMGTNKSGKTVTNLIRRDFVHEGKKKTVYLTMEQVKMLHRVLNEEGIESGMFGNIVYDVPMSAKEGDPSLNHKNMMADSWQGSIKKGKKPGFRRKK